MNDELLRIDSMGLYLRDVNKIPVLGREEERIILSSRLNEARKVLTDKEKLVLDSRYGEEPLALDAIGKKINLTRERVRQIETEALSKVRGYLEQSSENI